MHVQVAVLSVMTPGIELIYMFTKHHSWILYWTSRTKSTDWNTIHV